MIAHSRIEAWAMIEAVVGCKLELDTTSTNEMNVDIYKPVEETTWFVYDYGVYFELEELVDEERKFYIHIDANPEALKGCLIRVNDKEIDMTEPTMIETYSAKFDKTVLEIVDDENHIAIEFHY